jgi:hypothetical protein
MDNVEENMTDEKNDPNDGRRNPRKPFFMLLAAFNSDNTVNPEESVSGSFDTLADALEIAKDGVEDSDEEMYIYECRPVRLIKRGPVVVRALMKPAK